MSISIVILYSCSFIFIYNIPFTGSPLSGSKLMIIFMIIWMAAKRKELVFRRKWLVPVGWMIVLILYSVADVQLQRTEDYGLVYSEILFVINHILGCLLLINIFAHYGKANIYDILHMMIVISFAQSIIIVLSMLIPAFNNLISSIGYIEGRDFLQFRYGYARGYGLAASVTYDLAVCQAFAIMFLPYLIQKTRNTRRKIFYFTASFPILFSIFTLGRTGLVGVGLSLVYILGTTKFNLNSIKMLLYVAVVAIIGAVLFLHSDSSLLSSLSTYVFEGFDSFLSTGRLETHTGTNLLNMLKKAQEFTTNTWWIGDARYVEGIHYYMRLDIGILRDILYFGLTGSFLLAIEYFSIYKIMTKKVYDKQFVLLVRLLFIFLAVAHFKGEFLLSCGTGICMILMTAMAADYEKDAVPLKKAEQNNFNESRIIKYKE